MYFKLLVFLLSISSLGSLLGFDYKWTCNSAPTDSLQDPKIIIVGGGVAGVAAATRLVQNGFQNVKILEAENRLGGRVKTVPFGEKHVDLGGHWIHGREGNPIYEIASKLNLTTQSDNFQNFIFVNDTGDEFPLGLEMYNEIFEIVNDQDLLRNSTDNLYDFLVTKAKEIATKKLKDDRTIEAFLDLVDKMSCAEHGCDDARDVSTAGTLDYHISPGDLPGDYYWNWKDGGYNSIVDILLNKHSTSNGPPVDIKDVILNCEVTKIDWTNTEVLVQCADGSMHRADHVIVTVSLGVLKEQHSTLFNPPLPSDKINAINDIGIGTVDKIYLHFPHQWWPQNISGFNFLWKSEEKELTWEKGIYEVFCESTAPNVLGMWLTGKNAHQSEVQSEEKVKEGAFKVLTKFLGKKYKIPPPSSVVRSQWYTNNHFRGSYSYRKMGYKKTSVSDLAKPVTNSNDKEALMFAGEATHGHFYGSVHGAMETGWREADSLIKKYKLKAL